MVPLSNFLFAELAVVGGVARLFDLGGVFDTYNQSPTDTDADLRALLADWYAIGRDLQAGIEKAQIETEAVQPSLFSQQD